ALGTLTDLLLELAAREYVEQLVCPADLDVGFDGDRVVCLQQRVQDVLDRDRRLLFEALAELLAREHLLRGETRRETDDVAEPELSEPLALHDDADALARHDLVELIEVCLRVLEHLLVGHGRASIVAVGRVADLRRPVADDDHDLVPPLSEALEFPQGHGTSDVKARARRDEALFDPKLTASRADLLHWPI